MSHWRKKGKGKVTTKAANFRNKHTGPGMDMLWGGGSVHGVRERTTQEPKEGEVPPAAECYFIPRCMIFLYGPGPPHNPLSRPCQYRCGIRSAFMWYMILLSLLWSTGKVSSGSPL
uniref:Uncharacterized protein n=1 Tax=Anguilla anguilla TaxID=7936 RepID=A0A0E9X4I2_ANGAN